jgi:predicted ATP-dependent Lon-type protease
LAIELRPNWGLPFSWRPFRTQEGARQPCVACLRGHERIKPLRSLTEPLQVAKDNGAKRALIPIENKRNFLDVNADIMEHVDPVFYGDPKTAAMKVLGTI